MAIRAKLYYNHFDKNGETDGQKQIANIHVAKNQNDKAFHMEILIEAEDGEIYSTIIYFFDDSVSIRTVCDFAAKNSGYIVLHPPKTDEEDEEIV